MDKHSILPMVFLSVALTACSSDGGGDTDGTDSNGSSTTAGSTTASSSSSGSGSGSGSASGSSGSSSGTESGSEESSSGGSTSSSGSESSSEGSSESSGEGSGSETSAGETAGTETGGEGGTETDGGGEPCEIYCDTWFDNCDQYSGDGGNYNNPMDCMNACEDWDVGDMSDYGGDTVWCKINHAAMGDDDDNDHCGHAAEDSQGMCV